MEVPEVLPLRKFFAKYKKIVLPPFGLQLFISGQMALPIVTPQVLNMDAMKVQEFLPLRYI